MPYMTLSDVYIPSVFASYQIKDPIEHTGFVESGVAVGSPLFDALANGPGRTATFPFWNDLDYSIEPNYSNDVYTDIADVQKINTGEMVARVSDLNEGWGSPDLVMALNGTDPLKIIAAKIDGYWQRQFQRRLISTAIGVYNDNVAGNSGDMVTNIASASMTVAAGNQLSSSTLVSAIGSFGDSLDVINSIAMHSVVYNRLLLADQIVSVPQSEGKSSIQTFLQRQVIVDDGLPVIGGNGTTVAYQYLTILFGGAVFAYGKGLPKVPSEFERAPARANGGGFETLWSRKRWVIHPTGYTFTSATVTGPGMSPTWADLKLATNWTRIANRKEVPMAFIVSN